MVFLGALLWLGLVLLGACGQAPAAVPSSDSDTTRTRAVDGAAMVYVPVGEFLMGSTDADAKAGDDEKPQHRVYLDALWIDRTEVTNAQYVGFLNALGGHAGACRGQDCAETQVEDGTATSSVGTGATRSSLASRTTR